MKKKKMEDKYRECFNTDWNNGNDSKLSSMERARIHNLWLEYQHKSMMNNTPTKTSTNVEWIDSDFKEDDDKHQGFVRF